MLSLLSLLPAFATQTATSEDVLMYHVNPRKYGPVPVDMDTADEAGDLFFELMEVLTVPLACSDPTRDQRSGFECDNPEATSSDDVVNKLTLSITGGFSGYAMCNIGRNGTDGFGHACKDDSYCCFCPKEGAHHFPPQAAPCNATVGMSNMYERHGGGGSFRPCSKDYECFAERAGQVCTAGFEPATLG